MSFDFGITSKKRSKKIFMPFSKIIFLLIFSFILNSCTEPYALQTNTYEEALVVEATITNELKKQEITLTKTVRLEETEIQIEKGAEVYITDNSGMIYNFEEEDGRYISTTEFQVIPDVTYRLSITTKDGRSFESTSEKLPTINPMQNVTATVETKDSLRGVSIRVNTYDPTNSSKYYRYEYEETYKIIAPKWVASKATFNGPELVLVPNDKDIITCYSTKKNTTILLNSTVAFNEDRANYVIRFISDQNYIISHRYSILVKQYIENLAAYNYYKTLKKISESGSILSPTQPGILLGNISPTNGSNDKIVGYFDVTSVSTERIYFNYADLFPFEPLPPYYTDCKEFCYAPYPFNPEPCTHDGNYALDLDLDKITYYVGSGAPGTFIFWVNAPCGDCTTFSSNIKPPFWVD